LDAIKKEIQELTSSYASGGRAGYAEGEMVEEQVTETETMVPGPMAQSDNPISYDQLRARLPAEITDDIVELMANSAEALEDFAMISSQQDVDLFNQKYSVNLVLPSGA
jgi:Ni,Fe-hydrogenase III component G